MTKALKIFWLLLYISFPFLFFILMASRNSYLTEDLLYGFSILTGVLSFFWFLNQLIMSARIKIIETAYGLDRIFRFHAVMAVTAFFLANIHLILKLFLYDFSISQILNLNNTLYGLISLIMFGGTVFFSLFFFIDSFLQKIGWIRKMTEAFNKKTGHDYETAKKLHNLSVVSSTLLFIHVFLSANIFYSPLFRWIVLLYFGLAFAAYITHKVIKPLLLTRKPYTVTDVILESESVTTVRFSPFKEPPLNFRPGQFFFVTFLSEKVSREEHPFTISCSPTNEEYRSITAKKLGDFTATLPHLKKGDKVLVEGPFGRFSTTHYRKASELIFIAGGIGITPFLSMLNYLNKKKRNLKVTLLWAAKREEDLVRLDEIREIQKNMERLTVIPVLSDQPDYEGEKGLLDRDRLDRLLVSRKTIYTTKEYFLCGPPPMMEAVNKNLLAMGEKQSKIHMEKFSL